MEGSFDVGALRTLVIRSQPESPAEALAVAAHAAIVSHGAAEEDSLKEGWRKNKELYSLRFKLNDRLVLVKILDMEDSAIIHAMVDGSEEMASLEVQYEPILRDEPDYRSADNLFSLGLITFLGSFASAIVHPLRQRTAPAAASAAGSRDKPEAARMDTRGEVGNPDQYPNRTPTGIIIPPGAYDPFHRPRNPLSIGDGDMRGPGFGNGGIYGGGEGQGMVVGPHHPIFAGRGQYMPGTFPDAPGMVPGARFDPVGPFGNPGRGRGPGQLDPDNDLHQMPRGPGYDHFL